MPLPELRRFETTAFKSVSVTNASQVPAEAATLNVYKQGATLSADVTILTINTSITVYNTGAIAAGDTFKINTSSPSFTVVSVDSDTDLTVKSLSGNLPASTGDRLVVQTNRPTLYKDCQGTVEVDATNSVDLDATGYGFFYTPAAKFDYVISGSGLTSQLFVDAIGGWVRDGVAWVNVRNYSTFQVAINALPATGGTVYVPAGTYTRLTTPAVVPMTITKPVRLLGDGAASIAGGGTTATTGTRIVYKNDGTEDTTSNLITVAAHTGDWFRIEGIFFEGAGQSGTGSAIYMKTVYDLLVRDCYFYNFPSWAVQSGTGVDTTDDVVNCAFSHCIFDGSKANGLLRLGSAGANCFFVKFFDCNFIPTTGRAVHLADLSQLTVFDYCTFQTSMADAADSELLYVNSSRGQNKLIVNGCWFENNTNGVTTPTSWFIRIEGPTTGATIRDSYFARAGNATTSLRAIKLTSTLNLNVAITNCLGDLGSHATVPATDDLVIGSNSFVVMTNCGLRDANAYDNPWQISGDGATNLVRLGDGFGRLKVRGLPQTGAFPAASIASLTDINVGDMIYNTDNTSLNVRNGNGWQHVGAFVKGTTGAPSTGTWTIGDLCLNTTDSKIFICTASGTPGTWKSVTVA